MLERIVGNLVDNAVKHSPAGGAVTLEIKSGDTVGLTVCDQGTGVPQGDQAQLFNRFFRGDTRHGDGSSTGLGLAIAKAAAEAHGGRLEFVGNDPGAVFRLVLPLGVTPS
jgi:signal transduction histidine kinase